MDDSPRGSVSIDKGTKSSGLDHSRESAGFKGLPSKDNSALQMQSSLSPTTLKEINHIDFNTDLKDAAVTEEHESSADGASQHLEKPNIARKLLVFI